MKVIVSEDKSIFFSDSTPFMLAIVKGDYPPDAPMVPFCEEPGQCYYVVAHAEGAEEVAGPYRIGMARLVLRDMTSDLIEHGICWVCESEAKIERRLAAEADRLAEEAARDS